MKDALLQPPVLAKDGVSAVGFDEFGNVLCSGACRSWVNSRGESATRPSGAPLGFPPDSKAPAPSFGPERVLWGPKVPRVRGEATDTDLCSLGGTLKNMF